MKNKLNDFQKLYLATFDAVKAAKVGGLKLEQMIRLVENMYHVALDPVTIPDVFYSHDPHESIRLLDIEMEKAAKLSKETQELLEEKIAMEPIEDFLNRNH